MFGLKSKRDVKLPDVLLRAMATAPEEATIMCMDLFYSKPGVYNNAKFTHWRNDDLKIVGDIKLPVSLLDGDVINKYIEKSSHEGRFYFRNYEHLLDDYLKRVEAGDVDYESKNEKYLKSPKNMKRMRRYSKM